MLLIHRLSLSCRDLIVSTDLEPVCLADEDDSYVAFTRKIPRISDSAVF
jgi:hypothetical protein